MLPSSVSDEVQPNPRKRCRPARSCEECQRRKVKCDRSEPCSHCVLSKKQCHYGHGSAQARPSVNGRAAASQVVHGRGPNSNVPYATPPQASVSAIGQSPASNASRLPVCALSAPLSAQASHGIARSQDLGETNNVDLDNIATGPRDGRIALNKSRLFGQSHWTNSTLEVGPSTPAAQIYLDSLGSHSTAPKDRGCPEFRHWKCHGQ
jgi:hypothetical protein